MTDTFFDDVAQNTQLMFDDVIVRADGGRTWRELLFAEPVGFRPLTMSVSTPPGPGPYPTVIYVHGGAWMMGHPHFANDVLHRIGIDANLLAAGYAVAKVSYRMTSEGPFPMQLHDVKAAIRFLRRHADALGLDAQRFASMGESAGGHLALMIGLVQGNAALEGPEAPYDVSSAVACVVDWYGPTDLLTMDDQRPSHAVLSHNAPDSPEARLVGGPIQENVAATRLASPISYVSADAPPVLIQHGTADRLVPYGQGESLAAALAAAGAVVELDPREGADHCFWGVDGAGIMPKVVDFLDRHLR